MSAPIPPRPPRRRRQDIPDRPAATARTQPLPPPSSSRTAPALVSPPLRQPVPQQPAPRTVRRRDRRSALPAPLPASPDGPDLRLIPSAYVRTGTRLLSLTIDMLLLIIAALLVWAGTRSIPLALIAAAEAVIGAWGMEARTGATVGKLLTGTRSMQAEARLPLGPARAARKYLVLAASALVALIGAWALTLTARRDRTRRGRGWHDQAARGITVYAGVMRSLSPAADDPAHRLIEVSSAGPGPVGPGAAIQARPVSPDTSRPQAVAAPVPLPAVVAPSDVPTAPAVPLPPVPSSSPLSRSVSTTAGRRRSHAAGSDLPPVRPARSVPPRPEAPERPSAAAAPRQSLLISLDNGQRARVGIPGVIVLGRRPPIRAVGEQQVQIADTTGTVSKQHLEIQAEDGRIAVTDLGSTNGTRLLDDEGRSHELHPGEPVEIDSGTRLELGDRTLSIAAVQG